MSSTGRRVCHAAALALLFASCASGGRFVRQRQLLSPSAPAVKLEVASGFTYLGRIAYALDSFEGERFVFADSRDKALRRLVLVQFERVKPTSPEIYRYDLKDAQSIGPLRFANNSFAFAGARAIVPSPRDEADRTNNFLLSRGFRMPAVWLATRFVTLGSEDRKSEMIVFYMEGRDDLSLTDLYAGEDPTPAWRQMKPALGQRGQAAFTIEASWAR